MSRTITQLITVAGLLCLASAQAQLLNVTDSDGNLVNGTTILAIGAPTDATLEVDLVVTLNGTDAKTVDMVRYEEEACTGTQNYFCWGECWLPANAGVNPTWEAIVAQVLSPGVPNNGFHAYFKPMGLEACCLFHFVWFDAANVSDSVWVDIQFCTTPDAGFGELVTGVQRFDIAPNPSIGQDLVLSTDIAQGVALAEVKLVNALGEVALLRPLVKGVTNNVIPTWGLAPGVWMVQLHLDGQAVITRRLVITGR